MQFAMFLVDNEVISHEEFFDALKLQMRSRPQLGALAIETRRLNVKQLFAILKAQCDAPNEMFGEVAVRLGFITDDDLSELLAEQSRRVKPLSEVLVDGGILSPVVADRQYAEYRRHLKLAEPDREFAPA